MAFFLVLTLGSGVLLLLIAAIYLVAVNWSDEMYPRLISAFGIGTITLMVAVLASLKGSREDAQFTAAVIFDDSVHRPPILRPEPDRAFDPTVQRISNLTALTLDLKEAPQNIDEVFAYCAELLQYKLLIDLRDVQRTGTGVGQVLGSSTLHVSPSQAIVKLPDQVETPPSEFIGYDSNRFSTTESAAFGWKIMGGLRLPRGTLVEIQKMTGPERHIIRIVKKDYFTFEIAVKPVFGGATSQLPAGLNFGDEKVHSLTTYICDVTMTAQFEKLTAGNWRTEHYKRWVNWLISELTKRNRES